MEIIDVNITVNGTKKKIGLWDMDSKIFYIRRNIQKHFMRINKSWGLDQKTYEFLRTQGMKKVSLIIYPQNKKYECSVEDIENNKTMANFGNHRLQIFVNEKYWRKI